MHVIMLDLHNNKSSFVGAKPSSEPMLEFCLLDP